MIEKSKYATKKEGKTEVDPFWNYSDIKNMMDWFINHNQWDNYLIFMFGLLMGRRIGDTLSIKWGDLYYENGRMKSEINTIKEQKTGKTSTIYISPMMKETIESYLEKTGRKVGDKDEYVFIYRPKLRWIERKNNKLYTSNLTDMDFINEWCKLMGNNVGDLRKHKILNAFKKQQEYERIADFIYYVVEYDDILKSQQDVYRKQFKQAAADSGIEYPISTHSTRKTFGRITKLIHPNDIYCMDYIQSMLEHSSQEITRSYIGMEKEAIKGYYNDIGDVIKKVSVGETNIIVNNSPIVSLKHEDLREILLFIINEKENNQLDVFNKAMSMVDELKVNPN